MKYVDFAENGAMNRNNLRTIEEICTSPLPTKPDCYTTYFYFGEDFAQHLTQTKSVKGFKGEYNADFLPFDIDNNNLDIAKHTAIKIVECLQIRYGLYNSDIDIYFTGAKGFHIQIPSSAFGDFIASDNLANVFKELALEISAGYEIDPVIYEPMRLWRIPNTINSKTGLYKIQISVEELFTLSIEQIKELAKSPRPIVQIQAKQNQALTDLYWTIKELKPKPQQIVNKAKSVYPGQEKYCIYNMLNNGVPQGERNNALLRMAIYFNSKFNTNIVKSILYQWNNDCNVGLSDDEIDTTINSALNGYEYGCNDGLLKKYCSDKCTYPIKKQSKFTVKTIDDLEKEYIEYIKDIDNVKIDLSKWLPKFAKVTRGLSSGEVVIVIAGSGVGKTALLQNLILNIPVSTIFFSYELPEILTYERFYQIANKCTGEVVENHYQEGQSTNLLKNSVADLSLIFNSDITVDEIPSIVESIEKQKQKKVKIVAIDYLGFVKGGQGSRYERVSYIAEKLKDIAKKTNAVVICLAQVSRQEGAKGNEDLEITSGKDSGSIENTGDLVLGMYRPNKNSRNDEDNIIRIKILKNRKGKDNTHIDCYFNKETLEIHEILYTPEQRDTIDTAKRIFNGKEIQ